MFRWDSSEIIESELKKDTDCPGLRDEMDLLHLSMVAFLLSPISRDRSEDVRLQSCQDKRS